MSCVVESGPMGSRAKQILAFLAFVILFSSFPYFLIIHTGHFRVGRGLVLGLLMWCPAWAALTTRKLFRIGLASLGWSWHPVRYVGWAYVIPILYALPVYAATWTFIRGSFDLSLFAGTMGSSRFTGSHPAATVSLSILLFAMVGTIASLAYALGEEIGWRGFLLPKLVEQFGFTKGCMLSGCIWAVWHYPILLFADYNAGTNPAYALTCFTVMVIGMAYIMGWLRLKSNSLWPAAMLHASHNLFVQAIFDQMTKTAGRVRYITTEFGFGLALTVAATAFYFWTRRRSVEPLPSVPA